MADSMVQDESVVTDEALSAHLREVASNIVRYLPENRFRFQFFLIELSDANAFSLPGGRIYVSRKLIAQLQSDDELAGILAHELGHVLTHQGATFVTQLFRQALGVNSVYDRADIANKIHRVSEEWAAHKIHIRESEMEDQEVADRVAVYAMARAGFNVQAFASAFDRTASVHGKTGNWVTDLFHTTKPDQRRLRDILHSIAAMPPQCTATRRTTDSFSNFKDWQVDVVAYKQRIGREKLTGVLLRQKLADALRQSVFNLRFSPDGKYILAQDEGGIHVLTRSPLQYRFFIETGRAYRGFFSPDSKSVVFYSPELRLEKWDIATERRILVREMALNASCVQTALSPNGTELGCYADDDTLWIFDTATGNSLLERKNFLHLWSLRVTLLANPGATEIIPRSDSGAPSRPVHLAFSPDGRYFLAGGLASASVYDLIEKHEASIPHDIRNAITGQFVFLGNSYLAAVNTDSPSRSSVLTFPSGEKIQELSLARDVYLQTSSSSDYLIAGPSKDFALALVDLKKSAALARIKFDAADVFEGVVALEDADGNLSLVDLSSHNLLASVKLQSSRLNSDTSIRVTDDFKWLAVSTNARGGIWNLSTNQRVYGVRGFRSGWFGPGPFFYADFPKFGDQDRSIVKIDLRPKNPQAYLAYALGTLDAQQFGHYLLITTPDSKKSGDRHWTFELRDYLSKQTFWSRNFSTEYPVGSWDTDTGQALFRWNVSQSAAKEEIKQRYPLEKSAADDHDYFFELVDLKTNQVLKSLLLSTNKGSFSINDSDFAGDWLVITTESDELISYSLSTGKEISHVLGYSPIISLPAKLLVAPLSDTVLNIYDLPTGDFWTRLQFSTPVIFKALSNDGKRLFVLTDDQTVYVIDVSSVALAKND